jgi:hypothetical protein
MRQVVTWAGCGVLVYAVQGMVTLRSSQVLRRQIDEAAARGGARALVIDLRRTLLVMTAEDWRRLCGDRSLWFDSPLPTALLVGPELLPPMEQRCCRLAEQGYLRDVFTDEVQAVEWARLWAPVWPPRPRLRAVAVSDEAKAAAPQSA